MQHYVYDLDLNCWDIRSIWRISLNYTFYDFQDEFEDGTDKENINPADATVGNRNEMEIYEDGDLVKRSFAENHSILRDFASSPTPGLLKERQEEIEEGVEELVLRLNSDSEEEDSLSKINISWTWTILVK